MHPILGDARRLGMYAAAWAPVAALLAALLVLSGSYAWTEAASVALPLSLVLAFICLSAFYLARALPPRAGGLLRLLASHALAATVASALWVLLARAHARLLATLHFPGADERLARVLPLLAAVGALCFLLATAVHYVVIAFDAKHQAETRALELRVLSKDAELKALRSQLQPHFLFNSLNSISALTTANPEGARQMCVLLGDFLRQSLKLGARDQITLEEELGLVRRFLAVEQVRFGSRLAVEIRADDDASRCLLPPLLLQPLVENAITHGVANLVEAGTVVIEARRRGGQLLIAVENARDSDTPRRGGEGVGLANVKRRLDTLYGREASLAVTQAARRFRVDLSLPAVTPTTAAEPLERP
jgi:hypothetical protein